MAQPASKAAKVAKAAIKGAQSSQPRFPPVRKSYLKKQNAAIASTTTSSSSQPSLAQREFELPDSKMRALISLYHDSHQFITPATLDEAIDHAFVPLQPDSKPHLFTFADLSDRLRNRRSTAPMRTPKLMKVEAHNSTSGAAAVREQKILGALFGTDDLGRPGLETLRDLRREAEVDPESRESSSQVNDGSSRLP